jgi:hypothetical protein
MAHKKEACPAREDGLSFDEHGKIGIAVQRCQRANAGFLEGM